MTVTINGTTGIAGTNGSAGTPAVQGEDTNTGIFFPTADTVAVATAGAERLRVDSAGTLMVGTASSDFEFSGRGVVEVNGSSESLLGFKRAESGSAYLQSTSSDFKLVNIQNTPMQFWTNGTERARITAGGSLLFGTTSSASGSSSTFSTAAGGGTNFALAASHTATAPADVRAFLVQSPNYSGDSGYLIIGSRSNGDRFYVLTSGNVQNSNNSYGAISDVKVKENITDATPKLDKLNQVRVVNYNLIGEEHRQIGVIAQELEQIFPGMVEETIDRDAEGNDLGTTTKAVKYSVFVPMLIKAIQELTARVAELEAK